MQLTNDNAIQSAASILTKVKALLAKTVENGCTEAEASAAAAKVQSLLAAHNLSAKRESVKNNGIDGGTANAHGGTARNKRQICASPITPIKQGGKARRTLAWIGKSINRNGRC